MELKPVEGIRAVGPVGVKRSVSDVAPAFGVECVGWMEEDSYKGGSQSQERGLEDEDSDLEDEQESGGAVTEAGKVDVVA